MSRYMTKQSKCILDNNFKKEVLSHIPEYLYRIGYLLELQCPHYGNQWIYTEFDAFSQDINDYLIPKPRGYVIKCKVHNLLVKTSENILVQGTDGHVEFSPYNYFPISNTYGTDDNLKSYVNNGSYGCMQVHNRNNVLWAFNRHNDKVHDIGIGNNISNEHKDWTFMENSELYTYKRLRIYSITQDLMFNERKDEFPLNLRGVAHGDSLIWNGKELGQIQIPFTNDVSNNVPNFIIVLTGQSNSQGYGSSYDSENMNDQPHERIYGFNPSNNKWEKADLRTESLGSSWYKPLGSQCFAFHFARRLVEAYDDIRPGIINVGVGGQSISRWVKYEEGENWYEKNKERASNIGAKQGDLFDFHIEQIEKAMNLCGNNKVNVICWHQGESDGWEQDGTYYEESLKRVIEQYRSNTMMSKITPFIVGETTGGDEGTNLGWEARNKELRNLNIDADPYTKCIQCADLETSHEEYNNQDMIHFSSKSQRIIGTRYFNAFRDMFNIS